MIFFFFFVMVYFRTAGRLPLHFGLDCRNVALFSLSLFACSLYVKVGALVKRFLVRAKLIVPRHDEDDDDDEDDDEDGDSAAGGNNDNGVDDMDEEDEDDEDSGVKYRIGSMGYEFLLQNIHVQMWRFAEGIDSRMWMVDQLSGA